MHPYFFSLKVFFFLSLTTCLHAQPQFFLNGSATGMDSCFQLTTTENWQVGSIWYGEKVNLNESFEVAVDLFLGCKDDEGADGIVFGLQPISTSIGVGGGDLGIGGVEPSLGVEFDTYQNGDFGDPIYDHIAIVRDGIVNHNTPQGSLAGPIQADINNPNIEDCQYHSASINWDANAQTLSVYLECELRLSYVGDIVNEIFDGDPLVFWGFTSATGGLNNIHEVCFSYTSILEGLVDQTICPGEAIPLEANGGVSYLWTPSEGLSNPSIANPIAAPEQTTLYTVQITNDCGNVFYEDVLITVDNDQFDVEIVNVLNEPIEIPPGTEIMLSAQIDPFSSGNYTYEWTSTLGSVISPSDSGNVSVISSLDQLGTETITVWVTSENGCIVETTFNLEIILDLDDVPNVFTPDGDTMNDSFGLVTTTEFDHYHCKIFNRWGQLIFETNDQDLWWDGTFKGQPAPSEVYVYVINFGVGNILMEKKGDVTLLR